METWKAAGTVAGGSTPMGIGTETALVTPSGGGQGSGSSSTGGGTASIGSGGGAVGLIQTDLGRQASDQARRILGLILGALAICLAAIIVLATRRRRSLQ